MKKRSKFDEEMLDKMLQNPQNWKWFIYFNKKDPRLIVPKLSGLGLTFNFGNPSSYLAMVLIVICCFIAVKLTEK